MSNLLLSASAVALILGGGDQASISQERIDGEYSPAFEACMDQDAASRGVTPAMAACIHAELDLQDGRLNTAYRAAMRRLDRPAQASLRAEERLWIRQRDEECTSNLTGGTIDRIEVPSCLVNETIRRRLELEEMAR